MTKSVCALNFERTTPDDTLDDAALDLLALADCGNPDFAGQRQGLSPVAASTSCNGFLRVFEPAGGVESRGELVTRPWC
jgi:hypothetical protein